MKTIDEIAAMAGRLEDDILEKGWCPDLDAAHAALTWATSDSPALVESMKRRLENYLAIPPTTRRQEWINRGGDPQDWPEIP